MMSPTKHTVAALALALAGAASLALGDRTTAPGVPAATPGTAGTASAGGTKADEAARAATPRLTHAAQLIREGKLAEAERELIEADRLRPDYGPGLVQLSNVHYRLGKKAEALADLERVIRKGTSFDDKAYLLAARIFSEQHDFQTGQQKLVEWGGNRPLTANFHAAIGLLKLGKLELGPCEVEFRKALDIDPANDAALGGMFQLYARLDQYAKLQPFLERGLKAKPSSLGILMLSGNSLMRQERWAEAKDRFDRVLATDPKNAAALANRGSAKHHLGQTVSAIEDYRRSIELDPKGIEAPINLATVLESQRKFAEARDVLLEARKRGITDIDILNALSVAHDLTGETDLAIAVARESLQRDPAQDPMKKQLMRLEAKKAAPAKPEAAPAPAAKPPSAPPSKGR